jgi:hypothetical protein
MACLLTQSIALDCKDAVGGVKSIHLVNWAKTGFTVASGEVTATTIASGDVYTYEIPKATGSLTNTTNVSVENGTVYNSTDVAFKLRRMSTTKRNEMKLLAQGRTFCIVKNNNDEYWLVGKESGCEVSSMVANTGTAFGDANGYEITLQAMDSEQPYKLSGAVVTTLGI